MIGLQRSCKNSKPKIWQIPEVLNVTGCLHVGFSKLNTATQHSTSHWVWDNAQAWGYCGDWSVLSDFCSLSWDDHWALIYHIVPHQALASEQWLIISERCTSIYKAIGKPLPPTKLLKVALFLFLLSRTSTLFVVLIIPKFPLQNK